jgi:hypothetical protein
MKKTLAITLAISLALFMLFPLSGCKVGPRAAERYAEETMQRAIGDEGEVSVDSGGEQITITTDEGESIIGSTTLPDGFPDIVPVYPNMTIISSSKFTQDNKTGFSLTAETSDGFDAVSTWYSGQLDGWEDKSEYTSEGDGFKNSMISANKNAYSLWLQITEDESGTYITMGVEEN